MILLDWKRGDKGAPGIQRFPGPPALQQAWLGHYEGDRGVPREMTERGRQVGPYGRYK